MTTKGGKQSEKGRAMSFHKVTFFFLIFQKASSCSLTYPGGYIIALPPLEDLEKLFVMLRDRLFCRQHRNAGTLQRAGLALFKGKVQSTIFFILKFVAVLCHAVMFLVQ